MLSPYSRRLLLDAFKPPPGARLDFAVGTSYTVDLLALLTLPLAFTFARCEMPDGRPLRDPLALLKSVRRYGREMLLFCQAGKIHVPSAYQPLMTMLESTVAEVTAPLGGSFHPKVWALRFIGEDESVSYRLLCLSRNVTFDRSWDTLLSLDGELAKDRVNAYSVNHPLGRFFEDLPRCVVRPMEPRWRRRLDQVAHELRRTEWELPAPFSEIVFHPLGLERAAELPFPANPKRVLVVSPFVDDGLMTRITESGAPVTLVSRPESLDLLHGRTLKSLARALYLDETAGPDDGDADGDQTPGPTEVSNEPTMPAAEESLPLLGLHAKIYVTEEGGRASVWTGSANATTAGFERNVEFLVELRGRKRECGIDAVLGSDDAGERSRPATFGALLQLYERRYPAATSLPASARFEREADEYARTLAAAHAVARCTPEPGVPTYTVSLSPMRKLQQRLPAAWRLRVRPVSLREGGYREADPAADPWVEFTGLSGIGITGFFAFEVTDRKHGWIRAFVLNLPLEGAPGDRQEAVLRELLNSPEAARRLLLLLLMDTAMDDPSQWLVGAAGGEGKAAFGQIFDSTLLESLLRALDRDPRTIDEVKSIVDDLCRTEEGRRLLPQRFDEIWEPVWRARVALGAAPGTDNTRSRGKR